jgi:hypothetical protein
MGRSSCLILLLAAVISGCGSSDEASNDRAAPKYAATVRKALESWVRAARAGDTEMMCQLLSPRSVCAAADNEASMAKFLPAVRAEMQGLKGSLHYRAVRGRAARGA